MVRISEDWPTDYFANTFVSKKLFLLAVGRQNREINRRSMMIDGIVSEVI